MNKILDNLLQEVINEVESIGIKPGIIVPKVQLSRAKKSYGKCKKKGFVHIIYLSKYFIDNPVNQIKNTLAHEVLHTVEGCMDHGPKWKLLANKMNQHYGYNIQRTNEHVMNNLVVEKPKMKYKIECMGCGKITYRQRKSKLINNIGNYRCGICKSNLGVTIVNIGGE